MDKNSLANVAREYINRFANMLHKDSQQHFATALAQVNTTTVQRGPFPLFQHPAMKYLDAMAADMSDTVMQQAARCMDWGSVYDGDGINPALHNGMFTAQAAGTYGVFAAQQVSAGLLMLAPHICYPLHTHTAREVYHCLSGQVDITHGLDDTPISLIPGQSSETPSGRLHALQTGKSPVLLSYIWTGDLMAPTWWWEKTPDDQWQRTAWKRKPGESWKVAHTEPVSAKDFTVAIK